MDILTCVMEQVSQPHLGYDCVKALRETSYLWHGFRLHMGFLL